MQAIDSTLLWTKSSLNFLETKQLWLVF